jgi:hypothetical protein
MSGFVDIRMDLVERLRRLHRALDERILILSDEAFE